MTRARFFPAVLLAALPVCSGQVITTVAGGGFNTSDGILATQAETAASQGIAFDKSGNFYFWDSTGYVKKVDPNGIITTVAGNGKQELAALGDIGDGGPATSAGFGLSTFFAGLAVDPSGNLYIGDPGNRRVRKVVLSTGIITTFAGTGNIIFADPTGIAVDDSGNVYVADDSVNRVYKFDPSGTGRVFAGNGSSGVGTDGVQATSTSVNAPCGVALDKQGNVYIVESNIVAMRVRKVTSDGTISTVAGGAGYGYAGDQGPALEAKFFGLEGIAIDSSGNIYVADNENKRVRKIDTNGIINTVAGNGQYGNGGDNGLATNATLQPGGIALDSSGNLYITTGVVRKVALGTPAPGLYATSSAIYLATTPQHAVAGQDIEINTVGSSSISYTISSTTDSGGGWLSPTSGSGTTPGHLTITATQMLAAGTYTGAVTFTPTTPGYSPIQVKVTYVVNANAPATAPVITSVENGASFQSGYLPNSVWTIKGTHLAPTTDNWNNSIVNGQLPTVLDGVTVMFYGAPGYISYISDTQINLVTPDTGTGAPLVSVNNNGTFSNSFSPANGLTYSPAFFLWPNNQAVATHLDYTYAVADGTFAGYPTVAAKPGEVIILWGTGFGATTPATQVGAVVPSDKQYSTSVMPTVMVGTEQATVYGAALAPGFAALYQVAIQVPADLANGDYPIYASIGQGVSVTSPSGVILSVHN